jgi:hypothetical protein
LLDRLAQGIELALRSGAAPLLLGARLAGRAAGPSDPSVPARKSGLAIASKIVLDEIFFASELASATIVARRDHRRVVLETEDALAFYEDRGWLADPSGFHRTPPPLARLTLTRVYRPRLPYLHLRAPSGYAPHPGEPGRQRWLGYAPTHTLHAWLLRHGGRPRPWLVCIPGYRMGQPLIDFTGFRARWLHQTLGVNVAIPVLPLHGPRRVGWRGGDGFLSGDFVDTVHAQAQAVWDVRRLIGWLRAQGAPGVGVYGISLGGYTAALVASLESELACVIAGIPATDFVRLAREHAPPMLVRAAERAGFSLDRIERLLRVVSPLALAPRVPHARRFLYAGVVDRLASPDQASDLWRHWGEPRTLWYHGSHVSFIWEPEILPLLAEALATSGLSAPSRA